MKTLLFALCILVASVALAAGVGDNQLALYYDHSEDERSGSQRISNQRKATWRIQHNTMRKKYQVEYGGRYRALRWSNALEEEAHAWAEEIVKTCVNKAPGSGKNPNGWGVNASVRGASRNFQPVQNIMKLWENKLEKGYPLNQVMTQVLWRGTKFVGCSDAASPIGSEKTCTASVCYYGKAGNCLFKKYGNWTEAVINAPGCSAVCPEGVTKC